MLALARAGAKEGSWLRAERQTTGRGRMGRVWECPPGNLYASTLIRLRNGDPEAATLALVAAVALFGVVAPYGPTSIKWPNDLVAKDGAKLSGILLERVDDAVVVGFGVNLTAHPEIDRPVTSIAALFGQAPPPAEFCNDLAIAFAHWTGIWRNDFAAVRTAWLAAAHAEGTPLSVDVGGGVRVDGRFAGLAADGGLLLALADGSIRAIHAGDVFLI